MNPFQLAIITLCTVGWAASVSAGSLVGIVSSSDVIPIRKILDNPKAFHLQLVRVEGIVRRVEPLAPHDPYQPGHPCFGAYAFTVEDSSGMLRIEVIGHRTPCGVTIGEEQPGTRDGDHVRVEVRIQAPGTYIDKMTSPHPAEKTSIQAIATQIHHLKD